ncbi:hypothetical protein K2D_22370 [Planctomycetes bacterium K2D]|uniref:PEP-CTERM protein-sorting domain-containing protein n=2 Tax=Botrimarina mediterranea TaxID=2528022 RepID=A0A518K886_9BACT|nr:hypothetical protein Spa11_21990 [Botrimarina mediterranea]QDV78630.1 hypothetical protein K2D_22370 [Planctomycetes bacterium K2D]
MTAAALLAAPTASLAEIASPLITDLNGVFGGSNIGVDTTARLDLNNIAVYTMNGSGNSGAGFGVSLSNGENGIDSSAAGGNTDIPNPNPVNSAIASVNGGGRLQNGNVIRFSAWFQQDPNDPIVKEPSVEPVLKLELWKEYGSQFGDFDAGRKATAGYGDRLWDTDINAPDPFWAGFGQSEAARIDLNNNGSIPNNNGDPYTVSLPPTTGPDWVLVETTLLIDDLPDDQPGFGWQIGDEQFFVDSIEEVRGTMFVGDYAGNDLTAGGSFFVDNVLFEVFADEASLLATPNPNPMPKSQDFVPGDYNDDGVANAADYTVWRDAFGNAEGSLPNDINGGVIGQPQYDTWADFYGDSTPDPFAASSSVAIPEPTSVALVGLLLACGASQARRR